MINKYIFVVGGFFTVSIIVILAINTPLSPFDKLLAIKNCADFDKWVEEYTDFETVGISKEDLTESEYEQLEKLGERLYHCF